MNPQRRRPDQSSYAEAVAVWCLLTVVWCLLNVVWCLLTVVCILVADALARWLA